MFEQGCSPAGPPSPDCDRLSAVKVEGLESEYEQLEEKVGVIKLVLASVELGENVDEEIE